MRICSQLRPGSPDVPGAGLGAQAQPWHQGAFIGDVICGDQVAANKGNHRKQIEKTL